MLLIWSWFFSSFYKTSVCDADIVRNKSCLRSISFFVYSCGPTDPVLIRPTVTTRPGFGKLMRLSSPSSSGLSSTYPARRPLAHFFRKTYSINLVHFSVKNCLELLGKIFSPAVNQTVNPILAEFYDRHQVPWKNSAPFSFRRLWKLLNRVRAKIRTQATDSSRRKLVSTANARNLRLSYNWNPLTQTQSLFKLKSE